MLAMLLASCNVKGDTAEAENYARTFLDAVINNDAIAAYSVFDKDCISDKEFIDFYGMVNQSLGKTKSYDLKVTGWNLTIKNGIETKNVTFLVKTDDGKNIQLSIVTVTGYEGIAGIDYKEIESVQKLSPVLPNIFLIIFTLLGVALIVCMIVDLARKPLNVKKSVKVLLVILILVCYGVSVKVGASLFNVTSRFGLAIPASHISVSDSVNVVLMLPIGAIVYFFIRKKLPLKGDNKNADAAEEIQKADDTENTSDGEQ